VRGTERKEIFQDDAERNWCQSLAGCCPNDYRRSNWSQSLGSELKSPHHAL
jgi:hypothetical protein